MTTTHLCTATRDDVTLRGRSLTRDLMGHHGFTEVMFFHVVGRMPTAGQAAVLDACLVALMEHGLTPSAIATRMTYTGAPEAVQGAVAAGLLGVGGVFAGTMEACAALLARIREGADDEATRVVAEFHAVGQHVPGFGHPLHRPEDPRAMRLLDVAREHGISGAQTAALHRLATALDAAVGKHVPINVTGAFAAVLGDCGVPADILRGFALIARCAGLVGHVHEEQQTGAATEMWRAAEAAVPYSLE